jgi:alkylation response protein AidB-like acyl-CoA dehydrogenase
VVRGSRGLTGAVDAAIQMTSHYARERLQFGRPIGQSQGVKHPLAGMHVELESFRSLLYYGAWCRGSGHEDRPR